MGKLSQDCLVSGKWILNIYIQIHVFQPLCQWNKCRNGLKVSYRWTTRKIPLATSWWTFSGWFLQIHRRGNPTLHDACVQFLLQPPSFVPCRREAGVCHWCGLFWAQKLIKILTTHWCMIRWCKYIPWGPTISKMYAGICVWSFSIVFPMYRTQTPNQYV